MSKKTFLRLLSCILTLMIIIGSMGLVPTVFAQSSAVKGESDIYEFGFDSQEFATPDEEEYATFDEEATMNTDYISDPEETAPTTDLITLYFYNTEGWDEVYCHAWNNMGAATVWPGVIMEDFGNNIYKAVVSNEFTNVVFNNGTIFEEGRTPDDYIRGDKMIYCNGEWSEYEEFYIDIEFEPVRRGDGSYDHHIVRANVTGGTAPYVYSFVVGSNIIVSESENNEIEYTFDSESATEVRVSVYDSNDRYTYKCELSPTDGFEEETTTVPKDDKYTLYFRNHDDWYNVYAYSWNDGVDFSQPLGQWPGTACKYIDDDIWAIEVTSDFDYIIFNTSGKQSSILPNPGGFNIARWVSTDGNESEYEWEFPIITKPTEATEPSEVPADDIKVYFDNSNNYNQVFVYAWGEEDYGEISQWPGILATDENNGTWSIVIPGDCDCVLFHNGSGIQSNDLINPRETMIAKVVRVEDGVDIYDWFELEEITTSATDPTEEVTESMTVTDPEETETTVKPTETTATDAPETTATEATGTTDSEYALGDVDRDGKISIFDATLIMKHLSKLAEIDEEYRYLADVNMDEVINIRDATVIQKYLALLIAIEDNREIVPEFAGATEDGVNIDGKNYKVEVGDIVTYSFCLKTPKAVENIQAYVAYDAEKLRLTEEICPENFFDMSMLLSNEIDGLVLFNGYELFKGYDFTKGEIVVSLQFEVLDSSASEIVAVIENMAEHFGGVYFEDCEKKNDGVKVSHIFELDFRPTEPATEDEPEPETSESTEPTTTTEATETTVTEPSTMPSEPEFETGDVNCDSKVNIKDATQIQKYAAKLVEFTDAEFICADVNADGKVNIKDATAVQKHVAKFDTGLPIEKPVA